MSEGLPGIPGAGPQGVNFDKPALPGPPQAGLSPAFGQGPTYELSSWGRRAAAALIDGVVVGAIATVMLLIFGALVGITVFGSDGTGLSGNASNDDVERFFAVMLALLGVAAALALVAMLYAPLWMAQTNGRTLGKQVLGIRVVRADGVPMTFGFAVFREFLIKGLLTGFLAGVTVYLYALADIFWPLWDSEHRALHDHLAKTRVIRD